MEQIFWAKICLFPLLVYLNIANDGIHVTVIDLNFKSSRK